MSEAFNPAKVGITRLRFSTTQGEVLVTYGSERINQYGDKIRLTPDGWVGHPDSFWIDVAREWFRAFCSDEVTA